MATRPAPTPKTRPSSRLEKSDLLEMYRLMLLSRRLDDKEIQLKRQNKIFFQISGAGHEAVTVAAARLLRPRYAWVFTYSRRRALCLGLGMTPTEMLLSAVAAADDPNSGGRQMPSHWGHKDLNIVSNSSPTGTQFLQAAGAAEAWLRYSQNDAIPDRNDRIKGDELVLVSAGEGSTSEGEFWESLNTACNLKLPLLYLIEDNQYAISVPIEVSTAGGSISRLVSGFPDLLVLEVDGCDALASYDVLSRAVEHVRARKGPALVHARVIRPYSHSLSDDEILYRPPAERAADAARDPVTCFPKYLLEQEGGGGGSRGGLRDGARVAPARGRHDLPVRLFSRGGPRLGAVRHRGRSPLLGRAHHDGGSPERLSQGRDGARSPHPGVRGGRGRREPGELSRAGEGEGRRVQGDLGAAEAVRRAPGLQLAARGGQHHRAGHRARRPPAQAGGRDPVLRLHLARLHAAPERARDHALALQQRLQRAGGGAGDLRRLPQGRAEGVVG